ncbi:MAG: alpha/beta hydrolase [Rikenellaceae bacterium]|nr:alpha/beta hydrolase [Rikenellaceae bacterium]
MNTKKTAPDFLQDPHLNRATKTFLKPLNAGGPPVESLPPAQARQVLVGAQASVPTDLSGIDESERTITAGGYTLKLNIVKPAGTQDKLPVFIFIHGGGWVLGDYPTHRRLVRDLVVASGYASVFINYTPSPEARYPQAIEEIFAATRWVAEHGDEIGVDGRRLAVVGNSVGGNMAIATSLKAKEQGGPEIKTQVLLWPVTDATFDWESYDLYGEQRFLTTPLMKWMFDLYTTDPAARRDIHLSPLQASAEQLRGLPPTLIEVAENDILRDQGEALGRKLDEAGVDVTTIRFNGVIHDWGMLNGMAGMSETRSLIRFSAAMLKAYLG